ncbi:MAG: serine protease, partial [Planctomycetota bacterium]
MTRRNLPPILWVTMKDRQSPLLVLALFALAAAVHSSPAAFGAQTGTLELALAEGPKRIETLQERIQSVHQKVAPTLVSLVEGRGDQLEGVASGVLVSADGLVLTAGHCFESPGDRVRIQLPDGRVLKAVTLGKQRELDFGLIRIQNVEGLPFCELGEVDALCRDDVCLMYGHPDGIKKDRPAVVRLGTFLGLREDGMLRTSCLMMPGDSGGPLFDLDGKVVGINSEIDLPLDDNFHASDLLLDR